ncbi:venom carboxylesterase-6-like [Palaemon carinicauda]|uniref:venom carboxylesterase-6-like n=1 Tax=Palaemon carinicauda TaxID=392227 RepID=UPI0035B63AEF
MYMKKRLVLTFLVLASSCQATLEQEDIEVVLPQGSITGTRHVLGNGRRYYAFRSIPYALAPVGQLRFRDPVPAGNWSQPRNGSLVPRPCPQLNLVAQAKGKLEVVGKEDCLYLNVYTPNPLGSDLPVMVFIHGGAFQVGSILDTSPAPLMTEDVLVVTFQYRLGTLGFLSTEDSVLPGNLGLKDQTLALRWVKDNIQVFGGDPLRVTIFGTNAGGVSAHIQTIIPSAKDLVTGGILQSGTALSPWAFRKDHRRIAAGVGQLLNCSGTGTEVNDSGTEVNDLDTSALLRCLQSAKLESLVIAPTNFIEWSMEPVVMVPRVDGEYIPDDPVTLLKDNLTNKVNLITGINSHDGALTTTRIYHYNEIRKALVENFTRVGPVVMVFGEDEEDPTYLSSRIFHHYLGNLTITPDKAEALTQLITDRLFSLGNDQVALLQAGNALDEHRVYMYELLHLGQYQYLPTFNLRIAENWVTYGDELQYLFDSASGRNPLERPADLLLRRVMVKLWTNFAATGNPTPDQSLGFRWIPATKNCLRHLGLKPDASMSPDKRAQVRLFWNDLPTVQNKILFPEKFLPGLPLEPANPSPTC